MFDIEDIVELREQIQSDLCCILDGVDDTLLDAVCNAVADRCSGMIQLGCGS